MKLDHERLDVYQLALAFHASARAIADQVPRGDGELADQLRRAANSILLNICEGAGRFTRGDKRRFYSIAQGSANECGGVLDALHNCGIIDQVQHRERKAELVRVVQMLVRLGQSMQRKR